MLLAWNPGIDPTAINLEFRLPNVKDRNEIAFPVFWPRQPNYGVAFSKSFAVISGLLIHLDHFAVRQQPPGPIIQLQ